MKKLSHKKLMEAGKNLGGIKLACNCYAFENAVHFISKLEAVPKGSYLCGDDDSRVNSIINDIKK